ncbi:hypothetical protein WMY93_015802 [Mugilogobius chulae]|uniref:Secreted protein n=1 Tax=Mugilogobius chulae TaxID=88201 RepID=A0AAW0NRL7_9GOBI
MLSLSFFCALAQNCLKPHGQTHGAPGALSSPVEGPPHSQPASQTREEETQQHATTVLKFELDFCFVLLRVQSVTVCALSPSLDLKEKETSK